jgi:hypothetical protein
MHPGPSRMNQARRCRARSKRSGKPCRAPAVKGCAVYRMHGAGGGAPPGNKNALKHGLYSAEAVANATGGPLASTREPRTAGAFLRGGSNPANGN